VRAEAARKARGKIRSEAAQVKAEAVRKARAKSQSCGYLGMS